MLWNSFSVHYEISQHTFGKFL